MRAFAARRVIGHEALCAGQPECAREPRKRGVIVGIARADQPGQVALGLFAPADLGQHDCLPRGFLVAQAPPVGFGQIGLRMRARQVAAHLFMREHPVERFGKAGRAAQLFVGLFGKAAADQRAAGPVMRRGGEIGADRTRCAALERFGGLVAIAQPPGGEARCPIAFRDPGPAAAVAHGIGQRPGLRVLVLDVIAPRDPVAPFGARLRAQRRVHSVEQQAGAIGIVIGDPFEDRRLDAFGHRPVIDRAGPDPLGRAGLAHQIARARQTGRILETAG